MGGGALRRRRAAPPRRPQRPPSPSAAAASTSAPPPPPLPSLPRRQYGDTALDNAKFWGHPQVIALLEDASVAAQVGRATKRTTAPPRCTPALLTPIQPFLLSRSPPVPLCRTHRPTAYMPTAYMHVPPLSLAVFRMIVQVSPNSKAAAAAKGRARASVIGAKHVDELEQAKLARAMHARRSSCVPPTQPNPPPTQPSSHTGLRAAPRAL